jgi:glutamate transport system permease protein
MDVLVDNLPALLRGLRTTVVLTLLSCAIGLVLGAVLAICRVGPIRPLRWMASAYTSFMVNLPIAVWLILFYFGFSKVGFLYSNFASAVIVVSSWVAAYFAEAIRAGINAVPNGQAEAARALGLPFRNVVGSVVLPQALRSVILPIGVILNATYRNAAVAGFIDVKELALVQRNIGEATARAVPPLVGAFLGYFVLGIGTAFVFARLDRHYRVKR